MKFLNLIFLICVAHVVYASQDSKFANGQLPDGKRSINDPSWSMRDVERVFRSSPKDGQLKKSDEIFGDEIFGDEIFGDRIDGQRPYCDVVAQSVSTDGGPHEVDLGGDWVNGVWVEYGKTPQTQPTRHLAPHGELSSIQLESAKRPHDACRMDCMTPVAKVKPCHRGDRGEQFVGVQSPYEAFSVEDFVQGDWACVAIQPEHSTPEVNESGVLPGFIPDASEQEGKNHERPQSSSAARVEQTLQPQRKPSLASNPTVASQIPSQDRVVGCWTNLIRFCLGKQS